LVELNVVSFKVTAISLIIWCISRILWQKRPHWYYEHLLIFTFQYIVHSLPQLFCFIEPKYLLFTNLNVFNLFVLANLSRTSEEVFEYFFFLCAAAQSGLRPPHSWGFYIKHSDATHSVGLLSTSDQLVAETSTWQQTTLTRNKHPFRGGIRKHSLNRRATADKCLRRRGRWDWHYTSLR
jgi:hypothetical protein